MMAMRSKNLARTIIMGTFWTYAADYSGKFMVFFSTIVLARLLVQEDFGVAGYALVVINFLDVISELGIGSALIYYHEEEETKNTAFWLGLIISLVLFTVTWLIAPWIGEFFKDARAVPVTRVLALTFPISAIGYVHRALLLKRLAFRRKFLPDVSKALSTGLISIALAASGFGAWSLIWGQLGGTLISVIAYWLALAWRPSFCFSFRPARFLLSYGLNIVAANIISAFIINSDYFFIGRFLGTAALGVYTLAFRIPELLIMAFCNVITRVLFPVYATMRDETKALSHAFLTVTRYLSMITVPIGLGLALIAEPLVLSAFTEKWSEAIPIMRALAIYALIRSLDYSADDIYKAQGCPSVLTKLSILRAMILLPSLWWVVTETESITAIAWTQAVISFFTTMLNLFVVSRLLKTPFTEVLAAFQPAFVGGAIMILAVGGVLLFGVRLPPLALLILSLMTGVVTYLAALWWLQRDVVMVASQTLRAALVRSS